MSGRKYEVITQNGDCSRESNVPTLVFRNKVRYEKQRHYRTRYGKDTTLNYAIRRWLKQFQETGNVLHRKEREDHAHCRKMLTESRKRFLEAHKNNLTSFFAVIFNTNDFSDVVHNRLHLHIYKMQIV
jgi:hypothetical protein